MNAYQPNATRANPIIELACELRAMLHVENEHAMIRKRLPEIALERRARAERGNRRRNKLLSDHAVLQKWNMMHDVLGADFNELMFWTRYAEELGLHIPPDDTSTP